MIGEWQVVSLGRFGDRHVVPIGDLRPHVISRPCWCHPTDDEGVAVHHALDQREFYERGERRLN